MSKELDYTVNADGWIAGKWRAQSSVVSLTPNAAKYENVSPAMIVGIDLASGKSETVTTEITPKTTKRKSSKK